MAKYKLLQVENKVTYRGFLLVPMTWDASGMDESTIGERLSEDTFEEQESEVLSEWTVELPEGVETPEWDTVSFDDFKKYRIKE